MSGAAAFGDSHADLMATIQRMGIKSKDVLLAMDSIRRDLFVPERVRHLSYLNTAVGIDEGQSISQPYTVALMTEALEIEKNHVVLEIGTGSGYQAAILSKLCRRVYTVERHEKLAREASERFSRLQMDNIVTAFGDGMSGWTYSKVAVLFDRVIVTAAASDDVPPKLFDSLIEGGIMVIPLGEQDTTQELVRIRKIDGKMDIDVLSQVRFVPLLSGECCR